MQFQEQPLPPNIIPPPEGWVYVGTGHLENEDGPQYRGARARSNVTGEWLLAMGRRIHNPNFHYALPVDSADLIWPEQTTTPQYRDPDNLIPSILAMPQPEDVPTGWICIGRGSNELRALFDDNDWSRTLGSGLAHQMDGRAWGINGFSLSLDAVDHQYAVRPPHPLHAILSSMTMTTTAPQWHDHPELEAMVNAEEPHVAVPDGFVHIGTGTEDMHNLFRQQEWENVAVGTHLGREDARWWPAGPRINTWRGAAYFYAIEASHPLAVEILRRRNAMTTPSPARNVSWTLPVLPDGFPAVPRGWVYVGPLSRWEHLLEEEFVSRAGNPEMSRWGNATTRTRRTADRAEHHIVPDDSAFARGIADDPWQWPDQSQAMLPDGALYLGTERRFPSPRLVLNEPSAYGYGALSENLRESSELDFTFTDFHSHYAVRADSLYGQRLIALYGDPRQSTAPATTEPQPPANEPRAQRWLLSFQGAPVNSIDEFTTAAQPFVEGDPSEFTRPVWLSLFDESNPNDAATALVDRFPVLAALVDFEHVAEQSSEEVMRVAESDRPVHEIIASVAAGTMLRGGMSDHFSYTEDGLLVINGSNPPSLDQSYEMLQRTMDIKRTAGSLESYSGWTLGMLGSQMQEFFGENFSPDIALGQTSRAYNTYITAVNVFRECWNMRGDYPGLTFTHFKEVHYSTLAPEDKEFVLSESQRLGLSVAEQRKVKTFVRVYGSEGLKEDPITDLEDLRRRTETRAVNKRYLFYLRSENRWYEYKGPFEHIPNGASPILNADTRATVGQGGSETPLRTWTRPGQTLNRGHELHRQQEASRAEEEGAEQPDPVMETEERAERAEIEERAEQESAAEQHLESTQSETTNEPGN